MRIELNEHVACNDGPWGDVCDLVIRPAKRTLTHVVVEPRHHHERARLVPIARVTHDGGRLTLDLPARELEASRPIADTAYLAVDEWPEPGDGWTVGITRALALPFYTSMVLRDGVYCGPAVEAALGPAAPHSRVETTFDRIPVGHVELRRASEVTACDHRPVGHLAGVEIDEDFGLTAIVVDYWPWHGHREAIAPIDAVGHLDNDRITLRLARDELWATPGVQPHLADTGRPWHPRLGTSA